MRCGETFEMLSIRSLHWGDLDVGRVKITAFEGREAMQEFVERYDIAFKE